MEQAERTRRNEIAICKWMGWTYRALLETPLSVVLAVPDVMADASGDPE